VPVGSALKEDRAHRAAAILGNTLQSGSSFLIRGGDGVQRILVQTPGMLNEQAGRYEWILQVGWYFTFRMHFLTHQMFVQGGSINGIPIVK